MIVPKKIVLDISVLGEKEKTGVGVYTYNLVKNLLKINRSDKFILFGIVSFKNYQYLKNIEFKKYSNVELKIYRLPLKLFRTVFLFWQKLNFPKLESIVGDFDIFHSFNWYLPPVNSGKIVATVYDLTSILFPKFHLEKTIQMDKIRLERIKRYADLILAISENTKKDFKKFSPFSDVEVIYPGVSDIFLRKINRSEKIQENYILSVGTLEPRKNIKFLIKAYLKSRISEKLVLVGNFGWEESALADLINKNHKRIVTTGYVSEEDLPSLYKNAAAFVYPSFYEGFGLPVLEAMQSGVLVITSDTSSLPEVGGEATIYIDPDNIDSLVFALRKIKNQKLRAGFINKGLKQAKTFSWKKSADKLNSLYQKLAKVSRLK